MYYARQEYATLSHEQDKSFEIQSLPHFSSNPSQNRYTHNLPALETRIKLLSKSESDYINANLISLSGDTRDPLRIVCTQAPLFETFEDFWLMVWEQNSPLVCCLNEMEAEEKYWPSVEVKERCFGRFQVRLESCQKNMFGITVRRLRLMDMISKMSRNIIHMCYYGWPDTSLPDTTRTVRKCLRLFFWFWKAQSSDLTGPPIVHCLEGINRATSFIALLTLFESKNYNELLHSQTFRHFVEELKQIEKEVDNPLLSQSYQVYIHHHVEELLMNNVTIIDIVQEIRRQRNSGAIQRQEQYIFIYQVLKEEIIEPTNVAHILSELEVPVVHEKLTLNCDEFDLSEMMLSAYLYYKI